MIVDMRSREQLIDDEWSCFRRGEVSTTYGLQCMSDHENKHDEVRRFITGDSLSSGGIRWRGSENISWWWFRNVKKLCFCLERDVFRETVRSCLTVKPYLFSFSLNAKIDCCLFLYRLPGALLRSIACAHSYCNSAVISVVSICNCLLPRSID